MAPKRKGLGRGLDALIRDVNAEETTANTTEKAASTKTSAKKTGKAEVKGKTAAAKSAKSGSKAVKAAFQLDYTMSRYVTLTMFYDRQSTRPLLSSSSYPTVTQDFGFTMKFNLTR